MTEMKRISVAIPEDLDKAILDYRKRDDCIRLTYSEVIRRLLYSCLGQTMPDPSDKNAADSALWT